ncbi:natural product biosynthesis luciferase-like monooxygenase protein/non-ribosomal peptide synthase protein (TIGR01720 family) [Algoriphagus sp. 4150]|nr:natural product biosynthesis luciferase-like monooxygenase protein/non-ribosomal peptide synthase protein (TIGR01720 family) [Algoriphagus sp. 4150]
MNDALSINADDHIFSITSISFDISVLELLWSLSKGVLITLRGPHTNIGELLNSSDSRELDFSLFYFSSQPEGNTAKYDFLKESAIYADKHDFSALWIPERHFHEFGGIFPNPSVLAAGVSTLTNRIEIRSGSVVLPLHDVIRVAEEWSMVDNLSNGRVAMSIAAGWHSNDFILNPGNFHDRHEIMYQQIQELQTLWQGGSIKRVNGVNSEIDIKIYPRPVNDKLTIYITSAGNPETFISAGKIGANILTHLLGQDIGDLEKKIALYKQSLKENGFSLDKAKIALMVHTYIGTDLVAVKETAKEPFKSYLRSSVGLLQGLAKDLQLTISNLTDQEYDQLLDFAFERYWSSAALLGTSDSCKDLLSAISRIGVTEIACLIDFGIENNKVLNGLNHLNALRIQYQRKTDTSKSQRPITAMQITPSYLQTLINVETPFIRSLKHIIVGGEKFSQELLHKLTTVTDADVYNMYGPTETTIWSTFKKLGRGQKNTIGKPIQNTKLYVLDNAGNVCPPGIIGELHIGGAGLARGYLNRPDITENSFIQNHFATPQDKFKRFTKLYKTGDLVRWLSNGEIEYIKRNDDQVKLRGYRIELGEIEHALNQIPGISQCCVTIKDRSTKLGSTKQIIAYYLSDIDRFNESIILDQLSKSLPTYMLPSAFIRMDSLPLSVSGKLDRKALPDPEFLVMTEDKTRPFSQTELLLQDIWREVLGLSQVNITDDFFRIGGDSILSIQLSNRLRQRGFNCQVNDIFLSKTIEALAYQLDNNQSKIVIQSEQGLLTGLFELLPVQQWFAEQIPELAVPGYYNQNFLINVPPLTEEFLLSAIDKLVKYHDILRVHFVGIETLNQVYRSDIGTMNVKMLDVNNYTSHEIQTILTEWQSGFDLWNGPLFQVGYLYGYNDGTARIFFASHHMIIDGVSWRIIRDDIKTLYDRRSLPERKTSSYRQWVEFIKSYPENNPSEIHFWEKQLLVNPDFGVLKNDVAKQSMTTIELDNDLTTLLLQKASGAYSTEINDLLLTALAYALKNINGATVQSITLEGHGREHLSVHIDHSHTIGWFTCMFPVRLELKDSLHETIISIKEGMRRIPNKGIGFGAFASSKGASISHSSLPPIIFNYLGQFDAIQDDWQIDMGYSGLPVHPANLDLNVININGLVHNGKLLFDIRTQFGDKATIEFSNCFKNELVKIIEHCEETLNRIGTSYTPSDFKEVQLSQSLLNELQIESNNL